MTAPIMPESAKRLVRDIAERRGLLFEDLLTSDQGIDVTAARREAYARLMRTYTAASISRWMGRGRITVIKGAIIHRKKLGAPDARRVNRRQRAPEPQTAFSLWRGVIPLNPPRRSMDEICHEIARTYAMTVEDMKGPGRDRSFTIPRQHCMFVMSQQKHLSLPMIGKFLNRDHTTVLHGVRAHAARVAAEWSGREAA